MIIIDLLRIKQWIKNLLVFFPSIAAGTLVNRVVFNDLITLFFGFSFIVSSTYIYNDILDFDSDRKHPTKKNRPLASNSVTLKFSYITSFICFTLGVLIISNLDSQIYYLIFLYVLLTVFYSNHGKYIKFLDLSLISIFFILRIILGSFVSGDRLTTYFLIFIFFMSFGIVTGKKISIKSDKIIENTKVKTFLNLKYTNKELFLYLKYSFLFSTITFCLWIINENNSIEIVNAAFLVISIVSLILIQMRFIELTNFSKTEEIVEVIFSDPKLTIYGILFGITYVLGVYL